MAALISSEPASPKAPVNEATRWGNIVAAAVLMLATLPGRTQGLGLITEPMLGELRLDRVLYAQLNLGATLLGAAFCVPAGWIFDRIGLKNATILILATLAAAVWLMAGQAGGAATLFILLLATRALGQSALSVSSITIASKSAGSRPGPAMSAYAVLLTALFAAAFVFVGAEIRAAGWRPAWRGVSLGLLVAIPIIVVILREPHAQKRVESGASSTGDQGGLSLPQVVRTAAFWVFAGGAALFGLVSSGLGLFNEAVLAERGFGQQTYHAFLAATTAVGLVGQGVTGWLGGRFPLKVILGVALLIHAAGIAGLPLVHSEWQLWAVAAAAGLSGGMITVVFFAIWAAFGQAHLGRIQGAAQMLTVLASATGPLLFAWGRAFWGGYAPILWTLAPASALVGVAACRVRIPSGSTLPRAANAP